MAEHKLINVEVPRDRMAELRETLEAEFIRWSIIAIGRSIRSTRKVRSERDADR